MGVMIDSQHGIIIVHSELANGIMFWNPSTNSISVYAYSRLDPLGHLPSPFNIKFDDPLKCKPLKTDTDIAEAPPWYMPVYPRQRRFRPSYSYTSNEYHYNTVNLATGTNRQVTRAAFTPDRYTADNSALKHNGTDNGIMSLPLWFRNNQKIML
jgi:hypothetical protein